MAEISVGTKMKVVISQRKMTQSDIARRLGISRKHGAFASTGSVLKANKTGKQQKLNKNNERKIVSVSIGNAKLTAKQVSGECSLNSKVSVRTVCRVLRKNLNGLIAKQYKTKT